MQLACSRCSLNRGCYCYGDTEDRAGGESRGVLPPKPPVKAGWKGHEGESRGAETMGGKRKRDRQSWRRHQGRGGGKAQRCPPWARGWRAQLWCLSAASSSHSPRAHLTPSPPSTSVWVGYPPRHCRCCHTVSCCCLPHLPSWP